MSKTTTTLYLRGIPVDVVRLAKAAAALRGSTLGVVVTQALESALERAPGVRDPELEDDMNWYAENRAKLTKRYPNEYVAIVNAAVADHDGDFSALAERTFERYGDRPIFMPRVRKDRPIRFRSPRRAS
jgi:hypothetical protein